jgi:hypothetical protein
MIVGTLGLLLTLLMWSRRRSAASVSAERREYRDEPGPPP